MIRKILALIGLPLAVVAAFYISNRALGLILDIIFGIIGNNSLAGNEILVSLIIQITSFVIILTILSFLPIKTLFGINTTEPTEDNPRKHDIVLHIILAVSGFVVYFLLSMLLVSFFNNFEWFDVGEEQEMIFKTAASNLHLILSAIALLIVAPYFEEAIFRGWLYSNMRKARVNGILAALAVSLAFAFLHGQWNVAVDTFVLSMVACYLYEQTGSIRPAVLLHMIKNAIAFYFIFFAG